MFLDYTSHRPISNPYPPAYSCNEYSLVSCTCYNDTETHETFAVSIAKSICTKDDHSCLSFVRGVETPFLKVVEFGRLLCSDTFFSYKPVTPFARKARRTAAKIASARRRFFSSSNVFTSASIEANTDLSSAVGSSDVGSSFQAFNTTMSG